MDPRISVVIATRNRRAGLEAVLPRLLGLPERPRVVVADNGSTDGTAESVARACLPGVDLLPLVDNQGGAARTVGARAVETPYVAFSDDDSWWRPGALGRASDLLDAHPRLALVAARVLVGPEEELDPICVEMARGVIPPEPDLPGPPVLGFLACGAVVRRSAFLAVGGFERRYGIGGEEELLAIDLAAAGWGLVYADDVVAHHHPARGDPRPGRRRAQVRNALWTTWLRRPTHGATRRTARLLRPWPHDAETRGGLIDALMGLPWILRSRRPVPADLERRLRLIGN